MDNFDLRKYLAEGRLFENEEQGYTLYTTNVEYDNGKTGYMYQLVNSEDGEENEIGFDQLYFDDEDNRLEVGVDFNSFDQGSYQEGEYTADEAMELYRKISEGVIKEDYDKESLLKALGDADDAFIQLSDGRELIIYNPNSNNDDNVDMWGDYGVFAVSDDGDEEEVLYSDIAGINL